MEQIAQNILNIKKKISKAALGCGRDPNSVNLVAVSKRQSENKIREAIKNGQRLFGENKVQEACEHWQELKKQYPDIRLHLIGNLQTNKASRAVGLFDCIETVDNEKLALKLAAEMIKQNKILPCFIQVNTGEETQKAGIYPEKLKEFYKFCCEEAHLNIIGLMCIPPVDEPCALHFALLRVLAEDLGLESLSMGMSSDFEKAISLGATHIRVGTAVFGPRSS